MPLRKMSSALRILFAGQLILTLIANAASVLFQLDIHTWTGIAMTAAVLVGYTAILIGYLKLRPLDQRYQITLVLFAFECCVWLLQIAFPAWSVLANLLTVLLHAGQVYLVVQATNSSISATENSQELQQDSRNIIRCYAAAVALTLIASIATVLSSSDIQTLAYGTGVVLDAFASLSFAVAGFLYLIYLWQSSKNGF